MASEKSFDRNSIEQLIIKRFFYAPAFSIYGGVAGLYDYGPTGCALQANILSLWRTHFVLEEEMLEVDCTILTPADVFKTSGHVDKFSDWMCKDLKTGDIFRADHLVEAVLEARLEGDKEARGGKVSSEVNLTIEEDVAEPAAKKINPKKKKGKVTAVELDNATREKYEAILAQIDNYAGPELAQIIAEHQIKSPETGNDLSTPQEFNLMFQTDIGPTGQFKGYLRPETAQGQFVNFRRLLEFNNEKMPFASASIGRSFRNEISPRQGLLRVREFTMAEIEHFVDPANKNHSKFNEVKDTVVYLLPANIQQQGKTDLLRITIGEAVEKNIVDNQTLGYFLGRIYLFLVKLGIKEDKLRFRQHMPNEMAHYACDCWDAEILNSYGWIECVGCADRSAYDLTVHANRTKEKLVVREQLPEPLITEKFQLDINKSKFGPKFKGDAKHVQTALEAMTQDELSSLKTTLEQGPYTIRAQDKEFEIDNNIVKVEKVTITEHVREYTPNVIEPSFGIGRILYSLIEHVFWTREADQNRHVLSFPAVVAPFKTCLLPLSGNEKFLPIVKELSTKLRRNGISTRTDDSSATIGRRYSRNDELGIPYAVTIDFQTVQDGTVTLRERDTTKQIRETQETIIQILKDLNDEVLTWEIVLQKHQLFEGQVLDD